MEKIKVMVWDLPMRLFHWTFAFSLMGALGIAFLAGEHHWLFPYHTLLGLVAAFSLVLRIIMGVIGSRFNRFSALPVGSLEVISYVTGLVSGKAKRYLGHNPCASLTYLAMFLLVPCLVATGAGWLGEAGEELHEGLAIALGVTIGLHLAGLVWHTWRYKEMVALGMVTGCKETFSSPDAATGQDASRPDSGLASSNPIFGVLVLAAVIAWISALFAASDTASGTIRLPILGTVLYQGEQEEGEGCEPSSHERREHGEVHHDKD